MLRIALIQQGAWDMPLDSMPLAMGYLKAVLDADNSLAGGIDVRVCNFRGGQNLPAMARQLFLDGLPDVLAFSVLGWNYRNFGALAEMFKQLNPRGWVVFGGNHVAHQEDRVLRELPAVDIVVNGEGEGPISDLVHHIIADSDATALEKIYGISYRLPDGGRHTTPDRERIADLDSIPSPFLTGAIEMTGPEGRFQYDVALMETNRGCPYKCSFCYWGGAVGQRVRSFSPERLAAELDVFGFYQVSTVVLCDANFGLLESDETFVESLIRTRERHGYPRALEASWAKNKSSRFYRVVQELTQHGFKSSFTLALQTLTDDALTGMLRRNMKLNQWEDLADWLASQGLDCYAELIWGAPGETPESFLEGYDKVAQRVPRIAVYPLLLLPNTSYFEGRKEHGFVTIRGSTDDFEYVLANRTAPLADHVRMQRFMFWARILGENQYLRLVWPVARDLLAMSQSQVITSLQEFFDASADSDARAFVANIPVIAESPAVAAALRALYSQPGLERVVADWWRRLMVPAFPEQWRDFAVALYEYESWSRPRYVAPQAPPPPGWRLGEEDGEPCYVSEPVRLRYDVSAILAHWKEVRETGPQPAPTVLTFCARAGFFEHMDNHETAAQYVASCRPEWDQGGEISAAPDSSTATSRSTNRPTAPGAKTSDR